MMKLKFTYKDDGVKLNGKAKFDYDTTWMEMVDAFQNILVTTGGFEYLSQEKVGKSFSEILKAGIYKEKE